ncbi:hypothetical protein [Amycolatopsis sp. NPDC051071]|uniref:hypothetical protein n=1 Tax=Amycolatopsis sp. NPDC051071 TaxID=3154637 RepID=UPI00342A5F8B
MRVAGSLGGTSQIVEQFKLAAVVAARLDGKTWAEIAYTRDGATAPSARAQYWPAVARSRADPFPRKTPGARACRDIRRRRPSASARRRSRTRNPAIPARPPSQGHFRRPGTWRSSPGPPCTPG